MKKYYLATLIAFSAPNLVLALGMAQSNTNPTPQQETAVSSSRRKHNTVRHPRGPKTWFPHQKRHRRALHQPKR